LTAGRKRTPQASSPKRGKVSGAEKIGKRSIQESRGRRGMEKRDRMPERPGTLSRGRLSD